MTVLTLIFTASLMAQPQFPEGPGREETLKLCKGCHELERSISKKQDRDGWQATMTKMVAFGVKGTNEEMRAVVDYLAKHFPAEDIPPLNINEATAIEMESRLALKRSQAAAIIAYRNKNGKFKTVEDLKAVPNLDYEKIEARKDRIVF